MISFTDQNGASVQLERLPRRIISLVPSQTELLADLGATGRLVGRTKFCIYPAGIKKSIPSVGGTKQISLETVKNLEPDLVLANKEENVREQVETIRSICPVWVSDVKTLDDALAMINAVGQLIGLELQAGRMIEQIRHGFGSLDGKGAGLSAAYLIWKNPLMTVGRDTFIHDMMSKCGFTNSWGDCLRYPVIKPDELRRRQPDLLLLSSEPYPFNEKHAETFRRMFPEAFVRRVDGSFFSWYGSRLLQAPDYFKSLITI
jgi:ABC-type Fe3+-hydroxamate transport system substrate-binding protein